jgi:hypothetical protein
MNLFDAPSATIIPYGRTPDATETEFLVTENPIPPSNEDDSDDLSAFDDFVNKHLDFESRNDKNSKPVTKGNIFEDNEEDIFEDEEDVPPYNPFRGTPPSPFGSIFNRPGAPQPQSPRQSGSAPPPASSAPGAPPRNPMPTADDRRWISGYYKVRTDLEIFQTLPFMTSRVLIVTDANRRWNKRVRYIPNVAPGWAAIELRASRPIRGYVRTSEVRFISAAKVPRWSKMMMTFRLDWFDILVISVVLMLFLFLLTDVDETLFYSARPHVEALQTQIAEQQARIDTLEAQISGENAVREDDR